MIRLKFFFGYAESIHIFFLIPAECHVEILSGQLRPREIEVFLTCHQTFRKISKLWQLFSQIDRF